LGVTLTHEHFALKFDKFYCKPPENLTKHFTEKIQLNNVGYIKQYPYASKYNLKFDDPETHNAILKDVQEFKDHGGSCIVENTTHGIDRNLDFMRDVAQKTGVHIVSGTGHYIEMTQSNATKLLSIEKMAEMYTEDIEGDNKCGFIGEVGSIYPITNFERRSIQATAIVQNAMKCGVSFHPGRDPQAPFEILRIYLEAGGDASKCVMSHLDRTLLNDEQLMEFSKFGCYCQMDLFGTEVSWYQLNPSTDMPSDAQRVERLRMLADDGKIEKILMSHDIHTKHRLTSFGGHGFAHIIDNVKPKMLLKGFNEAEIAQIMVKNPANWLKF
jgi:phosphotriesterase-related protein